MIYVFGTLLVIAVILVGLARLKDVPGLADPPVFEPRNVKLHPSAGLSDAAVDRILTAIREEEGL